MTFESDKRKVSRNETADQTDDQTCSVRCESDDYYENDEGCEEGTWFDSKVLLDEKEVLIVVQLIKPQLLGEFCDIKAH